MAAAAAGCQAASADHRLPPRPLPVLADTCRQTCAAGVYGSSVCAIKRMAYPASAYQQYGSYYYNAAPYYYPVNYNFSYGE